MISRPVDAFEVPRVAADHGYPVGDSGRPRAALTPPFAAASALYSVSKQPRWAWQASGLQGTSSGPMTVVVCEHQYCAVGEETRRFTCSRPTT